MYDSLGLYHRIRTSNLHSGGLGKRAFFVYFIFESDCGGLLNREVER